MLVDAKKVKLLRSQKNWTQQHLADVCDISLRTIQRVEKDGVASHETVSAYAAIFELDSSDIILTPEEFENNKRHIDSSRRGNTFLGALFIAVFIVGIGSGVGLTLWLF